MLKNLDILEDHPNYYQRRPEKVSLQNVGKTEGLCLNAKNSSSKIDLVKLVEAVSYLALSSPRRGVFVYNYQGLFVYNCSVKG